MKTLIKIWITLSLLLIIGFLIWFPTENAIKGCMTTTLFSVELCQKSKNYVPLSQISKNIQNAIILTEDSTFYQHNGFDEEGIQHCFQKLREKMHIVCGGSTITQQLAKNMFLSKSKSFFRKGVEAVITFKLENTLTKHEILEKYLNIIQFGKNIYGIKNASQFYFKKQPSQISATEAAFLAMVLPNPEKYSQSFFRKDLTKFAKNRINSILKTLFKFGRIDLSAYNEAASNIDYFLKSGNALPRPKEHVEELTTDDLLEMDESEVPSSEKINTEKNTPEINDVDSVEEISI